VKVAVALTLFAVAQFAALIVSFFFFAAAAFAGDQRDPAMWWFAAGGVLVLGAPGIGLGFWWRRRRARSAQGTASS
jgi:hypothetical protein